MAFALEENLQKLFITGTLLSIVTCLSRPDFNFPLLVFSQYLWKVQDKKEKLKVLFLISITLLVDFIWLVFWGPKWTSDSQYGQWESGTHKVVLTCACFIFILKICIVAIGCYLEQKSIQDAVQLLKKQGNEQQNYGQGQASIYGQGQASFYGQQTPYRNTTGQYGAYPSQSPMRSNQQGYM